MEKYVECESCRFVLTAAHGEEPEPRHWEECPECGATAFRFADAE